MKRFLLDTSVLIDFSKGRQPAKSQLIEMLKSEVDIGVCAINLTEFFSGLPQEKRKEWSKFFAALLYWHITKKASVQAGIFRADYQKKGKQLSTADALIAAVSISEQATVVTNNIKDYPMEEVSLLQIDSTGS